MKASEVAFRAAEAIDKFGWHRESYGNEECGFCFLGSIGYAIDSIPDIFTVGHPSLDIADAIIDRAMEHVAPDFDVIYEWNDAEGRTKEEVTGLLRKVAKELESE